MIRTHVVAPDFMLLDQRGQPFRLSDYRGRGQVLISFIPAAFTPICTTEVPAFDALADRFVREANTVPVVVTPDNAPTNAAWARQLGLSRMRLLGDWNPHGAVSQVYGAWNAPDGLCDRASVLVGADGRVRFAESVGKFGKRNAPALLDIATRAAGNQPAPAGQTARMALDLPVVYATTTCPHCQAVEAFLNDSPLAQKVVVRHVDGGANRGALQELLALDPEGQVPLLAYSGQVVGVGDGPVIDALRTAYRL